MSAEAKLISAICKHKDIVDVIADNPDQLFRDHSDIWEYTRNHYFTYGSVPDITVLEEKFRDFDGVETRGETLFYLDELREHYVADELKKIMIGAASQMQDVGGRKALEGLHGSLADLGKVANMTRDIDVVDIESAIEHYSAQRDLSDAMGGTPGIPTTFASIDSAYSTGMGPGHLGVVIGYSGYGKTSFATLLACKAWEQGFKPMIVSLEMSPEAMRNKVYTILGQGRLRNSNLSRGDVDDDMIREWGKERLEEKQSFTIVSSEGQDSVTPAFIQAKIDQYRPSMVVVDYQQLLDDNRHSRSEVEKNRNISKELKSLATRNRIPVWNLSQATIDDSSDITQPPQIEQVAWSKGIQHDADLAIAVHYHPGEHDGPRLMEIVGRKNRHGPLFAFYLNWDMDSGSIEEVTDFD